MLLSAPHKQHLHFFDQVDELAESDGKIVPYLDVSFVDNYSFKDSVLRYSLAAPNQPERVLGYNMGTKKTKKFS